MMNGRAKRFLGTVNKNEYEPQREKTYPLVYVPNDESNQLAYPPVRMHRLI